ncbi:hypothetical protein CR513_14215, partial [Mucuna pruriens]
MFELLTQKVALNATATTQGVTLNAAVVSQGTTTYPPGFTLPYLNNVNTREQSAAEGHEQASRNNLGAGVTQGLGVLPPSVYGTGPQAQFTGAPHLVDPSRQTGPTLETQGIIPPGEEKLNSLEKRVRIIEDTDSHDLDAADLCLVLDIVLLANFKTPKFEKYKGSSCPRVHLAMYCRKMAPYTHQDKILVHYFQDSLTGAALNWYVNLEKGQVKTWRDLAEPSSANTSTTRTWCSIALGSKTCRKWSLRGSRTMLKGGVSWQPSRKRSVKLCQFRDRRRKDRVELKMRKVRSNQQQHKLRQEV